jgi:putative transposase
MDKAASVKECKLPREPGASMVDRWIADVPGRGLTFEWWDVTDVGNHVQHPALGGFITDPAVPCDGSFLPADAQEIRYLSAHGTAGIARMIAPEGIDASIDVNGHLTKGMGVTEQAIANRLRVLAYCIMTNHVHIVAIPETGSSIANTFRHAHGRFSQYWNTERKRTGHVWQNRYYSCPVEEATVGRVIGYVENNPVSAGMVKCADEFEWSSAAAHVGMAGYAPMLDRDWWQLRWTEEEWSEILQNRSESEVELRAIRAATYTGRPLGSKQFVVALGKTLGRRLEARPGGRARKETDRSANQLALWASE